MLHQGRTCEWYPSLQGDDHYTKVLSLSLHHPSLSLSLSLAISLSNEHTIQEVTITIQSSRPIAGGAVFKYS